MIREINDLALSELLSDERFSNVFIVAPNFEERSIGAIEKIVSLSRGTRSNISVLLTTLQAVKPREILDEIKENNARRAKKMLEEAGIPTVVESLIYPDTPDPDAYFRRLIESMVRKTEMIRLFIDISSLPRRIIFRFIDFILDRDVNGARPKIRVDRLDIDSINFMYTPAESYPSGTDADLLGSIRGLYSGKSLHRLVESASVSDVGVLLAGNSHDAAQCYDDLTEVGITARINSHAFVYLNQENLLLSYRKLALNIGVVNRIFSRRGDLIYFFSIEQLGRLFLKLVRESILKHKQFRSSVFLTAPFGPKPVSMISYFVKKKYDRSLDRIEGKRTSDILVISGGQYTSIYSYGRRATKTYSISLQDIYMHEQL